MPERQRHAKIANEMADRLQRSANVPRWNKSEWQNHRRMGRGSRDDIRTSHPPPRRARAEGEEVRCPKLSMLSAMEYPDWMMVAGAVLLVLGFIGFVFSQNR
jgi:hypothetical protein